jgi:hypothetical protein
MPAVWPRASSRISGSAEEGGLGFSAGRTLVYGLQPASRAKAFSACDKDRGSYVGVTYYVAR